MAVKSETLIKLTDVRTKTSLDTSLDNIDADGVAKLVNLINQNLPAYTLPYYVLANGLSFNDTDPHTLRQVFLAQTADGNTNCQIAYNSQIDMIFLGLLNNGKTTSKIVYDPTTIYPCLNTGWGTPTFISWNNDTTANPTDYSWLNSVLTFSDFTPCSNDQNKTGHFATALEPRSFSGVNTLQRHMTINTLWLVDYLRENLWPAQTSVSTPNNNSGFTVDGFANNVSAFFQDVYNNVGRRVIAQIGVESMPGTSTVIINGCCVNNPISTAPYGAIVGTIIITDASSTPIRIGIMCGTNGNNFIYATGWSDKDSAISGSYSFATNSQVKYWIL